MPGSIFGYSPAVLGILRGVTPDEVLAVGEAVRAAGVKVIEVAMNSPGALESISILAAANWDDVLVGAGTVMDTRAVGQVADAGGRFVVSPNLNLDVVAATKEAGLHSSPGCMTPTEVFTALAAGADVVKLFPGDVMVPNAVRAIRAVVPKEAILMVTGGVSLDNIASYMSAGADGIGLGSALYKPGKDPGQVRKDGEAFLAALQGT